MKPTPQPNIHSSADVQSNAIGAGTNIWQFVVVLPEAKIGQDCNICAQVFIENKVTVGDRVTIKNGVQLWDGIHIEDDVFIGPNVTFTNDKQPRSKVHPEAYLETTIRAGASIGGGATILPGITVGEHAMIGAGAVVTRSVPPNAIVIGNPARIVGYVDTRHEYRKQTQHEKGTDAVYRSAVAGVTLSSLPRVTDIRGSLTVGEFQRSVPFEVKRYFMVFDVPSVETRGEHAHHQCHQFLICVRGKVSVVADDGTNREEFVLDGPDVGLHLPPMTWGIQYRYSPDALLLVFASHYYDSTDYIRNYQQFIELAQNSR